MSQNKIYVGSLAYEVTDEDLKSFFGQYGEIEEVKLITDRDTGRSKGFAFITYTNQQSAQNSLAANGTELKGRKMRVNPARDRNDGGGRRGSGERSFNRSRGSHQRERW